MSAHQGTDDGGHGTEYLLGHRGENLVLAPIRVNDIRRPRGERGFEAATSRGLLCDLLNPGTRISQGA
jgi:hypothetical protein